MLALILITALGVRVTRARAGLPYLHDWDEPQIVGRGVEMLATGDLNPAWFNYGSLNMYMSAAVSAARFAALATSPGEEPRVSSPAELAIVYDGAERWTASHPSFYFWGRAWIALLGTVTVLVTYLLARALAGPWSALAAAALVAGLDVHIEQSAVISPNGPAGLFAALSLWCAVRFAQHARPSVLVGALIAGGLAAATKYNAAVCLAAAPLALALTPERRKSPWLWAAVLVVPGVVFLCAQPYALLDAGRFVEHLRREAHHYASVGHGANTVEPGLPHLALQLGRMARNATWVASAIAVLGFALVLRRREGWVFLSFPLLYLAGMSLTRVDFHRNFVLLYPVLAVGLACGLAALSAWLERAAGAWARAALTAIAVAASVAHLALAARRASEIGLAVETRAQAISAAAELAAERGWTRVGVARELHVHPLDLERLGVAYDEQRFLDLVASAQAPDAWIVPAAFKSTRKRNQKVAQLEQALTALRRRCSEVAAIDGVPWTEELLVNPGVLVLQPAP